MRKPRRGSYLLPSGARPVEFQKLSERRQKKPEISAVLLRKVRIRQIGRLVGYRVWIVDDELVRNALDVDFCMGSHFAHSAFVPTGEIWVSRLHSPTDLMPLLVHEAVETEWMAKKGWTYERAHDRASLCERELRHRIRAGKLSVSSVADAMAKADAVARELLSSK